MMLATLRFHPNQQNNLFKVKPNYQKEYELWSLGYRNICGIDEAGRGALAGPLVAGAVILKRNSPKIFNDSKKLTKKARSELFEIIKTKAAAWSVALVEVEEINRYGIQSATYVAYNRALEALNITPDFLMIDHYRLPATKTPQNSITKGDQLCQSIAAASIVAKVWRDNLMAELDADFPDYKLKSHLGYGTRSHLNLIGKLGPSKIHRTAFISLSAKANLSLNFKLHPDQ